MNMYICIYLCIFISKHEMLIADKLCIKLTKFSNVTGCECECLKGAILVCGLQGI